MSPLTELDNTQPKRAVIYCRVSSKKQANNGSGLKSQEHRCRDYAASKGYMVDAVFPDDISGGGDFMNRPGMVALLAYLDARPQDNYVVIFDDLKRYARDTEFHLKLRRIMAARGATRECLNFQFENTPEGKFIETMLAAQGELEREQNGRQVVQKMKARLEQGFWCFQAPIGYRYQRSKFGGKELVRDEPAASLIQEALEGFASGRFQTQVELKRFLESQPLYPKSPGGVVHQSRVVELLDRCIYAGYIEAPKWDVGIRKGRHEGLISYETYLKNQQRIKQGSYAPARKDINADFPLRGFVECADCGTPLTSCWSKGKTKKHPYYLCQEKSCKSYGKSIRRTDIEAPFEDYLKALQPTDSLVNLLKDLLQTGWSERKGQTQAVKVRTRKEIENIQSQIDGLLERIVETQSPTAASAYERKITMLEKQKLLAEEQLESGLKPITTPANILELTLRFVANPWNLWETGNLHLRKLVLKLAFNGRLVHCRESGYRTPKIALPFSIVV